MNKFTKLILTSAVFATGAMAIESTFSGGMTINAGDTGVVLSSEDSKLRLVPRTDGTVTGDAAKLVTNTGVIKGKGTLEIEKDVYLCNVMNLKEVDDETTANNIKEAAATLLGLESAANIGDVFTMTSRGSVDSELSITDNNDNGTGIRNYSLLSTLSHLANYVAQTENLYGENRLFNFSSTTECTSYADAIHIGGSWNDQPMQEFSDSGAMIATVPTTNTPEPAGIGIASPEFELSLIRACTGPVYVHTEGTEIKLSSQANLSLPGAFETSYDGTEAEKITIDARGNTLTFEKKFNAKATGIHLQGGTFNFEDGLII